MTASVNVSPFVRRRLDGMLANDAMREGGRKLVEEGLVEVRGYPDAKVDLLNDWSANPYGNRSWQWNNAAFRFMPGLLAYHAATGSERALDFALDALASWDRAIRGPLKSYEFARHDHATASQAEQLLFLLAHVSALGARPEDHEKILLALVERADLLATDAFYSRGTNHGIEQSRILAMVGDLLHGHPDADRYVSLAVERLEWELDHAFTPEGVSVENSPGYHCYVCVSFLKVVECVPSDHATGLVERIDAIMPKAMRFLTHIVRPDGMLPIIGDTARANVPDYFKRYRKTAAYRQLRFATSAGKHGVAPKDSMALFPRAGYFAVRDRWEVADSGETGSFQLIFRCGYRSDYHRHDDDLNIVLYAGGEDWLIDSGAYNYNESDPLRRYVRSKWGHNVPVVLQPKARRWDRQKPAIAMSMVRLPTEANWRGARGVTHGYPGHVATRDVLVDAGAGSFQVVDSVVQATALGRKRYLSLWHVPADKDVLIDGQTVTLVSKRTGHRLVIENTGRRARSVSLLDPGMEGVDGARWSTSPNQSEPAHVVAFEWAGAGLQASLRFQLFDAAGQAGSLR